ncbi:MAG: hypothetical protein C0598_13645 [Marinilabiliales bacterium]|nr:MAG: hypothetical protein C0598_13645 [Marinilabiliales bacterium]
MTTQNSSYYQIEKIGAISGILSIVFYFSVAVFSFIPGSIVLLIAFSFPLLWIISFMGLYHFLKKQNHTPTLEIAYIFGIIGAAIACVFIVVQQANFIWHEEAMEVVKSEEVKALYKASYRGANRVQAAMDVAFDIFITISWVLFGVNIAKSKSFNKILGYGGSVISISLLALNMYTFPTSPAESGLFDLGPFLGIWILLFYVWFLMVLIKKKKHS